jgi:pimeloyl-ACP methyl ester carboxylesterase
MEGGVDQMDQPGTRGMLEANGTSLYYEKRGSGPPLLFISGASGDAADYTRVAELLAGEFTAVTYDRRGFSRSPWPEGATWTWVDQQADDAAALLLGLGLRPAAVYGGSIGALTALSLLLHHPQALTRVMLHEPPLMAGLPDPTQGMLHLREVVGEGKAKGGLRGGREAFVRASLGEANYEALPADYRERLLSSASTFLIHEFDRYEWYRPADEELASVARPVVVLAGTESPPFFRTAAEWLASRLRTEVVSLAGGHTPQRDQPQEVADAVRRFLAAP